MSIMSRVNRVSCSFMKPRCSGLVLSNVADSAKRARSSSGRGVALRRPPFFTTFLLTRPDRLLSRGMGWICPASTAKGRTAERYQHNRCLRWAVVSSRSVKCYLNEPYGRDHLRVACARASQAESISMNLSLREDPKSGAAALTAAVIRQKAFRP